MRPATRSRADGRRMRRLVAEAEPTIQADRRFFERRPDRTYRIRRACRAELAQLALIQGEPLRPLPPGAAPFAIVKQLATGVRIKVFVTGPADEDGASASDGLGAALWDRYAEAHPGVREREAAFRAALAAAGRPTVDGGGR